MVNLRSKTNSSAATPWHRIYFCAAYPSIPLQPKPSPIIVTSHDPTSRSSTRSCLQEKYHAQHQQQYRARAAIFFSTSTERAKHQHARNVTICSCLCRNTHTTKRGLQTLSQPCRQEIPGSAMCVQNFDDSRGLAIRITYRISLRSSSLWKPRHPLLKVVKLFYHVEHFR